MTKVAAPLADETRAPGPPVTAAESAPPPAPARLGFRIGGNFGALDWAPCPWVDIVYNARGFGLPREYAENLAMPRDANGWPVGPSRIVVCSNAQVVDSPLGVYKGSFTGPGGMVPEAQENCRVSNTSRSGDRTTFDVTCTGPMTLILRFTDSVRDLRILTPGYAPGTLLRNEALNFYKRFANLRMMGLMEVNHWQEKARPETTWERRMPGAKRGGKRPWEACFEFLAAVHDAPGSQMKEAWICTPLRADENYVRQVALMAKRMLPADMIVYAEYGNEIWESSSGNMKVVVDATMNPSDCDCPRLPATELWARFTQLWAVRHARQAKIWREVLGDRARPVLCGHAANIWWTSEALRYMSEPWMTKLFGPLTDHTKALSLAPYLLGPNEAMDAAKDAAAMLALLRNSPEGGLVSVRKRCADFTALAKKYGIDEVTCYEWGLHTHGSANGAVKRAAHLDPAVQSLVADNVQAFREAGVGLVSYHAVSPQKHIEQDVNSLWGVCQSFTDASPKLKGLGV